MVCAVVHCSFRMALVDLNQHLLTQHQLVELHDRRSISMYPLIQLPLVELQERCLLLTSRISSRQLLLTQLLLAEPHDHPSQCESETASLTIRGNSREGTHTNGMCGTAMLCTPSLVQHLTYWVCTS